MKNFFGEFKKFITRGNVVDMAVGVIVGSSFTAIVNGLSNFILKPVINWMLARLLGKDSLSEVYTFLLRADKDGNEIGADGIVDLTKSIYIDWGAFINAVINFFLVALVLFVIVKTMNKFRDEHDENVKVYRAMKRAKKEMKAQGIKKRSKKAVKAYLEEEQRLAAEAAAAKAAADAEAARLEREANPTTEDLLKLILAELKK